MRNYKTLNWTIVENSSQITGAYFDMEDGILYIRFANGAVWMYNPFTLTEYRKLFEASSIGSYFHREIKPKKTGKKLTDGNKLKE